MYKLILLTLIFLKILILLTSNPLIFGIVILLICGCICFITAWFLSAWFSLIFFLVYIGGILVLIFYTLILNRNPSLKIVYLKKVLYLTVIFRLIFVWFLPYDYFIGHWEVMGVELWYGREVKFLVGILSFLLIVLWLISKLKFNSKSAFRPIH